MASEEAPGQKLVFDSYSDSELNRLWIWEYNEKDQLKYVDFKKLENVRQQQVELLGSEQMYKRVNDNLKNLKFEAHFAQEQSKLFHWREEFFWKHFPLKEPYSENDSCWTHAYNITQLWPRVATFACCFPPPRKNRFGQTWTFRAMFDCGSEMDTYIASHLYQKHYLCGVVLEDSVWTPKDLKEYGLNMKDVFHLFVSDYSTEPLKLKDIALKNAMAYGLSLEQIPKTIKERAEKVSFVKSM